MSTYITQSDIEVLCPPDLLRQALDDNGDGPADTGLFDGVVESACREVDSYLSGTHVVPLASPYPAVVTQAARLFALDILYTRRGAKNPNADRADAMRAHLGRIGNGELPLTADTVGGVEIVSDSSRLAQASGHALF